MIFFTAVNRTISSVCIFIPMLFLASCNIANEEALADSAKADTLLLNAQVYTVNTEAPWAEAVAIKNEKIVFVGSQREALLWKGEHTKTQDLQGGMLLPGFIDSHSHILLGGAHVDDLLLSPFDSPTRWVEQVQDFAENNPNRRIIMGGGFLASRFGQKGPTKELLDHIKRPVFILDDGMHGAWLNSAALKQLGINKQTKDPLPGFDYYKRDLQGEPTGYILEGTVWTAIANLMLNTPDSVAEGTAKVIEYYNAAGITSVFDAGPWEAEEIQLEVLEKLYKNKQLNISYTGSYYIDNASDLKTVLDKILALKEKTTHTTYKVNTLKIMVDGTLEGRTAAMFEDYQGDVGNKGETVLSPAQLNELVEAAVSKDLDIHFHSLGERAISETLDAIELAKKAYPQSTVRFTVSHIQIMVDKDIERFSQLGVIAQGSLLWAEYDTAGEAFVSKDQFERYYRYQSLVKAGVKLTFGNDYPSSGSGVKGISPLLNIEVGLTRQTPGVADAPIQNMIDERLTLTQLIKGYTLDGAYQLRRDHETGSIMVGKYADLVLIQDNLFNIKPHKIHSVPVLTTWWKGRVVFNNTSQ